MILDTLLGPPRSEGGWTNWNSADDRWYFPRAFTTTSGEDVSAEIAMTFATVFACVAKLSKTIATLPVSVMERVSDDERRIVADHPLVKILQVEANPDSGAVTWREMCMAHLLLWGNWFAEEVKDNGGQVVQLKPLYTAFMRVYPGSDGRYYFSYQPPYEARRTFAPGELLHLSGLSLNGVIGSSVINWHRETVGTGLAATKFSAAFYGNGTWMGGWLKQPAGTPAIGPDKQRELLDQINERFRTAGKAFGLGFLAEGLEYQPMTGMPLKDAEFLGSRQFTRVEICSIFDVPPSKVQNLDKANYNTVEQMNIDWVTDSILPWCVRIESALKRRYFPDESLYVKHNLTGLLRGDRKSRYDSYAVGRQWGWLTANDVLRMEDMDAKEGGDFLMVPVNMALVKDGEVVPVSQPTKPALPPPDKQPEPQEHQLRIVVDPTGQTVERPRIEPGSFAGLFLDAAQQVVTKEVKALENAFKRRAKEDTMDGFRTWLTEFYGEHVGYFCEKFKAPLETAMDLLQIGGCELKLKGMAAAYTAESLGMIQEALKTTAQLPGVLTAWKAGRAEELVQRVVSVLKVLPASAAA